MNTVIPNSMIFTGDFVLMGESKELGEKTVQKKD